MHIAVATNKREDFVNELMEKYAFRPYVEAVYGTDFEGRLNKEDLIQLCMEKLQVREKQHVVMIGDSVCDAEAARKVGIDFIGVTYGFDFKNEEDVNQWENVGCLHSILELEQILFE